MTKNKYGLCDECNIPLQPGECAILDEKVLSNGYYINTGRQIFTVGYLICPICLKRFVVDDSFDYYV